MKTFKVLLFLLLLSKNRGGRTPCRVDFHASYSKLVFMPKLKMTPLRATELDISMSFFNNRFCPNCISTWPKRYVGKSEWGYCSSSSWAFTNYFKPCRVHYVLAQKCLRAKGRRETPSSSLWFFDMKATKRNSTKSQGFTFKKTM